MMGVGAIALMLGAVFTRGKMKKLNEERKKGGLEPITVRQLVAEVRDYEVDAMRDVLRKLAAKDATLILKDRDANISINGRLFPINKLRYRINKDGS